MASVFIQIASFHDYELEKTILDAIEKSSKENELFFGIHSVFHKSNNVCIPELDNVRCLISKAPANIGIGQGRALAHSLYEDEDYYLQIDSHSRFAAGWDKLLIEDILYYKDQGINKPALTAYPAQYRYVDGKEVLEENPHPQNIILDNEKHFKEKYRPINVGVAPRGIYQKSVSGGFIFTEKPFINVNKNIAFAEEFNVAMCLYTNGYDLIMPRTMPIFHQYSGPVKGEPEAYNRKHVWYDETYSQKLFRIQEAGDEENKFIIQNKAVGKYWLGTERTLDEFAKYAGLNFDTMEIIDE
jgi:hypothetical protein